jgi:tetratricopeptide (TPR) repeat protein
MLIVFVAGLAPGLLPGAATAGGSPETTLIIVNADSAISQSIANSYRAVRDIPQSHLVRLHGVPSLGRIDVNSFREHIWRPIRRFMTENHLDGVIDTIAYSADFPYAVDLSRDIKANRMPHDRYRGSIASLTGVTYFAHRVERADVGYLGPQANLYFRRNLALRTISRSLTKDEIKLDRQAERALGRRDYEAAVELYRSLTADRPEVHRAWFNLARALAAQGRTQEAWSTLQKAVEAGWPSALVAQNDRYLKKLKGRPGFDDLLVRMEARNGPFEAARGFRSRYAWGRWSLPDPDHPSTALNRYYLATLLAYTGIHGNSLPEVLRYLNIAVASDGSRPDGTVYLLVNNDIRSRVRQRYFIETAKALAQRGRRAELLTRSKDGQNGIIPVAKDDVIGAVVGAEKFDWQQSRSRFLPGAIAESLTSYSGHFDRGTQTKLTEFLRHGAAGSSGAVAEPFSIQAKFPVPLLHVHYADGVSLAEAFYASVASPYQLIVVGDPLARPFARFAQVTLARPDPGVPWRGTVTLRPAVDAAPGRAIRHVELWVDGVWVAEAPAGQPVVWDTRSVADGSHELRLVAVESGPIETRSYQKLQVVIDNHHHELFVYEERTEAGLGDTITISGIAPGATQVVLLRGFEMLDSATPTEGAWQLKTDSLSWGLGESLLHVRAEYPDGSAVRSSPITVRVREPGLQPSLRAAPRQDAGLEGVLTTRDGVEHEVVLKKLDGLLRDLPTGLTAIESLHLSGFTHVGADGFYQLAANSRGRLTITINGRRYGAWQLNDQRREAYVPLGLQSGWHSVVIDLMPAGEPRLKLVLSGAQVAKVLAGDLLGH